ncbi:MAG: hypothetical protein II921_06100 [Treponema sp.]|nr:hypothetical protein [Treponema sp.]
MNNFFTRLSTLLIFSLTVGSHAFCESFKVKKLIPVSVEELQAPVSVSSGLNDALCITLPEDKTFVTALKINIKIPEEIASKKDFLLYSVFDSIRQTPTERRTDYSGEKISEGAVPQGFTHTIYIPLSKEFSIKESPYASTIEAIPSTGKNFVFFRLRQSDDRRAEIRAYEKIQLEVSVQPILLDKGILALDFSPAPSDEDFSVYIDDEKRSLSEPIFLSSGEHRLSLVSNFYRNEVRTFRIEKGRITTLPVHLRGIEPTLQIICPKNAEIFLDNKPIENSRAEFVVSQGEHIIKFMIGDYDVIKSISAEKGRSYTVNLTMDASIQEND